MYNVGTWSPDCKLGGTTIRASAVTASGTETGTSYEVGKGKFRAVLNWTVCETGTGDEFYNVVIEANSRAATSTYYKIGTLGCYGCAALTSDTVTPNTGEFETIIDNPYDYQIRVKVYCRGSIGSGGLTHSVVIYPLADKN
jgi:hypothetical protein